MDDELERWAKAWKSMEVKEMNLMKHAQTAHRHEAVTRGAMAAALGFGMLLVVEKFESLPADELPQRWPQLAIGALTMVLGALLMRRWGRQIDVARTQLVQTPVGVVSDLIRLRERELGWWVGKPALITAAVLSMAGIVLALLHFRRVEAAGEPVTFAKGQLLVVVIYLVALAVVGVKRVRYLRRDLVRLRELHGELQ
jgi:hypothetical protein